MEALAKEYEESAKLLKDRISMLNKELSQECDLKKAEDIKKRIAELRPLLRDCIKIYKYLKNYYKKDFYIGGGIDGQEPFKKSDKLKETGEFNVSITKRTNCRSESCRYRMSNSQANLLRCGARTWKKQIDCLQDIL